MTRPLLYLATLTSLLSPALAAAGGRCSNQRFVTPHQPVYYHTPAPRPAPLPVRRPQHVVSRPATPPPNVIPTTSARPRRSSTPVMSTVERLDTAKQAFKVGHHNVALAHASLLIDQMPDNANLLQFRSLVYFRKGDYRRAALDAYEAVKHGAIWNKPTITDLYAYPTFYNRELRLMRLDATSDLQAAFLSAYHHLVASELDLARQSLGRVLAIKPNDKVSAALVNLIDTKLGQNNSVKLARTSR